MAKYKKNDSRVSSLSIDCRAGRYGERCSNLCSETCGGLANTCDRVNGTCNNGCDHGYTGTKCDQGKLSFIGFIPTAICTVTLEILCCRSRNNLCQKKKSQQFVQFYDKQARLSG